MNDYTYHIVPILDTIILPNTDTKLNVDEALGLDLKNELHNGHGYAIAATIKEGIKKSEVTGESFYKIGTLLKMDSIEESSEGFLVYAKSIQRIELDEILISGVSTYGNYHDADEEEDLSKESKQQMLDYMKNIVHDISEHFQGNDEFVKLIDKQNNLNEVIAHLLPFMQIRLRDKYELLRHASLKERGLLFIEYLGKQKESIDLQVEMAKKYSKKNNKSYREAMLREQLKAIQLELGDTDDDPNSPESYGKRIEESKMSDEARKAAKRELRKLESGGSNNSEAHIIRNYLDLMLDIPWESNVADIDISEAKRVLNTYHYGMDKVKQRIMEHLAVMKMQNDKQGSIILLVGPPGTGKTSLGKSIAEALGREYVRVSLGGVRDEAEIRGHRRTYLGALPGRIIQGMKKAGTMNPVFVLDEIDKLSVSNSGDPSSALLEVLDPEQNNTFADHYLEVPYDLSDVLFVATANNINTIPGPLLDRLEVIQINSYTNLEKLHIGRDHLIDASVKEHGLSRDKIIFTDEAIQGIIDKYTREAGVRGLRKEIDKIIRKVIEKIVTEEIQEPYEVKVENLIDLLGHQVARHGEIRSDVSFGVVTGLAWTPVGGDILFIEGTFMPGNGNMLLTGQLGDVMKESARIALSLVKSRLTDQLKVVDFNKNDIHVHVPSGATPKDGPSAGVTMLTAMASLATGKKVDPKLAMTGEITLSGHVLPVGGIKEKILAAHRAGIEKIIMPKENEKDLMDVPAEVTNDIQFLFVERIEEVLELALAIEIIKPEDLLIQKDTGKGIGFNITG